MKTKEQILTELEAIKTQLTIDTKKLEEEAEKLDIYIRIDEAQEFSKRIRNIYPILNLSSNSTFLYNGLDSVTTEVLDVVNNPEKTILSNLHFQSIDTKKKTFTLYSSGNEYYFYYLTVCFGFAEGIKDRIILLKSFLNGKHIYSFTNDEEYKQFEKIVFYTNDITNQVIKLITDQDKADFKVFLADKKRCVNKYNFIWNLKEKYKIEGRTDFLNYYLLFNHLQS